ncbi:MAG: protein kinase, partial [Myxococcales bacterium]|nr:protein kinase [Myxococcales bacterium]
RDFKPDNVMIGDDGRVRVMDFGLASVAAEPREDDGGDDDVAGGRSEPNPLTRSGTVMGTPAYMAPEQHRAEPADAASDQFAFCIALYEALYGERPFAGATLGEQVLAVTSGELREAPASSSVPGWLREIVCRGLASDRAERFESMQALLDALVEAELAHEVDERQPPAYVFVVHDGRDKQQVLRLCEGLIDLGVRPWLDMWEAGERAERQRALAEAPAVIVCGAGEHAEVLAARIARDPTTVYAARLPGSGGLGDRHADVELDEASWDEAVLALARLVGIDHERRRWLELEAARAGVEAGALSPYRGLEAFREQDARWMFGRDAEVASLLDLIRVGQTRFLTLIGASGSGKSSLLMAGVCPMLRHGVLGDGAMWSIAYLRPGSRPCEALAHAIVGLDASGDAVEDGLKIKRLRAELRDGHDTLRLILGRRSQGRTLLVIDQLEELFTEAGLGGEGESEEALAFVRNLLEATQELTGLDSKLWIAATLRADFVQRALEIPALARALQVGTYFALPPMSESQIRAAIERPAARVGHRVEAKLVDKLVGAAAHQAGRLPLLQHVLRELWARRDASRRLLREAVYAETGGLEGAIATAAERALAELCKQLGADAELSTRRLVTRLVHLGNRSSEDTRRRVALADLDEDPTTRRVLEVLVGEARVLVAAEVDGRETVEIAHEALLREWTTLVGWLDADREALKLRQ